MRSGAWSISGNGLLAFAIGAAMLSACSTQNTNLSTVQINQNALPYPENYRAMAHAALRERAADETSIQISSPQTVIGRSMFEPRRWFVCVRGLEVAASPRSNLWNAARSAVSPTEGPELVLIYEGRGRPSINESAGSDLCRGAQFEETTLGSLSG